MLFTILIISEVEDILVVPYGFLKNANFELKKCVWTFRKRMELKLCIEWRSGHQILTDKVFHLLL